jgi:hypothetical protein
MLEVDWGSCNLPDACAAKLTSKLIRPLQILSPDSGPERIRATLWISFTFLGLESVPANDIRE